MLLLNTSAEEDCDNDEENEVVTLIHMKFISDSKLPFIL